MPDSWIERVKLKFERDFTMTPNEWARDPLLSRGARGLLTELLSHDAGFRVSVRSLVATGPEGRTAIDTLVRELKAHDYLEHEIVRGVHGRIDGVVWRMTDPAEVRSRRARQPHLDIPDAGTTGTRKTRHAVNQHLKEAQQEEHLSRVNQTNPSTRAGEEEVVALPSDVDLAASIFAVCPVTGGGHSFEGAEQARPDGWCTRCGQVKADGSVYDRNGRPLRAAEAATT